MPAVLIGFSGFLRYLQTDAGIIPYLKLGHDHCLTSFLVLHSLLIPSLSAVRFRVLQPSISALLTLQACLGVFFFATRVFYCLFGLILSTCSTHCLLCLSILYIGGTCTVLGATRAELSPAVPSVQSSNDSLSSCHRKIMAGIVSV